MRDIVLVLTNSGDPSVESVLAHFRAAGQAFRRFDTETFPERSSLNLHLSHGDKVEGALSLYGGQSTASLDLNRVKSVWLRRPIGSVFEKSIHSGYAKFAKEESGVALWSLYSILGSVFWMNHPLSSTRMLEHNKLYQLRVASRFGLEVPDTLITNDPEAALAFAKNHNGVVAVKMLKGNFFIKEGSNIPQFVFTQRVGEEQISRHWNNIRLSPIMVQEYVPKNVELRVTIVGTRVFACTIRSQDSDLTKHDWRKYDFGNVRHELCTLPEEIEQKLISLLRFWNLSYGAIDLVQTPDGRYVFLEINPNGQWGWIEELTGAPIAATIAQTLMTAPAEFATVPHYLRD